MHSHIWWWENQISQVKTKHTLSDNNKIFETRIQSSNGVSIYFDFTNTTQTYEYFLFMKCGTAQMLQNLLSITSCLITDIKGWSFSDNI